MKSSEHPLRRLSHYARRHRGEAILASSLSILNKLFDLAPPLLIGVAVEIVVSQEASFLATFGVVDVVAQLWVLSGFTLFIWGMESLFQYLYSMAWRKLAQNIEHDLRNDAYTHVQDLEMSYFEDQSTGSLMSILNNDINQLERFLDDGLNQMIHMATTVIVVGGLFVYLAPSVAWMALLPMPFILWGSVRFQHLLAPRYVNVRAKVGLLNHQLANNLSGIATIKSYATESYESKRIEQDSEAYRQSNFRAIKLSSAFVPIIRMLIAVGFVGLTVYGGLLTVEDGLSVGAYTVLVFMTQRLLWPLTRLGTTLDLYQRAMASTRRVMDLLDTDVKIIDGHTELVTETVKGAVVLEGVSFEYGPRVPVIHDVSMSIQPGQMIGLVGPTGSGKSTLIKLLLRFYDVDQGRLSIDGRDIRELKMQDLRNAIGLVSQDVFLFHGTVRENIAYGKLDASDEEIEAAARTAEAHTFIMALPEGYNTIVGERGQKLSGGQRQRVSIARAVLKDPPILVLDEATSSVDNETEAAIQRSMQRIIVDRTTIVIAHRLSTIRNADQIFVLERGSISESGQHEALLAEDGIYAGLWRVQTGQLDVEMRALPNA
jgi:ATP-binding cassette subfamily B protein